LSIPRRFDQIFLAFLTLPNKNLIVAYNKLIALKRIFICCMLCIFFSLVRSQTLPAVIAGVYTKTTTYSALHNDAFSFAGNPAALAGGKQISAGFFGERKFLLEALSSCQLAFALPTSSGNFGFLLNYFGNPLYNESGLGLAYARNLGKIDVGTQFNYLAINENGYGTASAVNFEAGFILHLSDQFRTGVHIYNPTRVSIGKNNEEKLPVMYSFGLGYDASDKFFIGSEIVKVEDQPLYLNAGMQYSLDEKLFARAGITSATSGFWLGFGFLVNGFRIDATASFHPSLGITPGIELLYKPPPKK
jgi:hypothetical protein